MACSDRARPRLLHGQKAQLRFLGALRSEPQLIIEKSFGASLTKSVKTAAAAPGEPLSLYLETSFSEIMRVRREASWWQFFAPDAIDAIGRFCGRGREQRIPRPSQGARRAHHENGSRRTRDGSKTIPNCSSWCSRPPLTLAASSNRAGSVPHVSHILNTSGGRGSRGPAPPRCRKLASSPM